MSDIPKKMMTLLTSDQKTIEVEEAVAKQSMTLKHLMDDECDEGVIPVPNVEADMLEKVIRYCKKHVVEDEEVEDWDRQFLKDWGYPELFRLIRATNYLDIESLMDLCCHKIADMIKDKSVEQVREIFNIPNDFTPEEEAKLRKENQWAHQP